MNTASKKAVVFKVAGVAYSLCFSTNALVEFEKISGLKATQIAAVFGDGKGADISFDRLRQVFWAGLSDAHEGMTERQAGQIMDDLGTAEVGRLLGEALTKAFGTGASGTGVKASAGANAESRTAEAGNAPAAIG